MKKNRLLLMLFTVAVALLGVQCSDDDGISTGELSSGTVSLSSTSFEDGTSTFDVPVTGGEYTLSISCDDVWSLAASEDETTTWATWAGFSAVSGEGSEDIIITVFENTTANVRNWTLTVTVGELEDEYDETILPTADFTITQAAGDMSISISESRPMAVLSHVASTIASDDDADADDDDSNDSIVDSETNTATFNVVCNDVTGWDISIPEADTWLSTLIVGNQVTFFVEEYEDELATEARESVVTFSCKSNSKLTCDVIIRQNSVILDYPPTIELSELADLSGDGGTATVTVTCENLTEDWTAKVVDESGDALSEAWVSITEGESGSDSGDITIAFDKLLSVESTSRAAYLVVSVTGAEDSQVILTQTSSVPSIAVAESADGVALSGVGSGASATLNVTANTDWTVETVYAGDDAYGSNWFSITAQDKEEGTISIKAADWYSDNGGETRTVTVKISYDDFEEDDIEVVVTQTAQKAEPATYNLTLVDSNTLSLEVTNTAFAAGQTFTTSAYTVAYENDYAGSTYSSGKLAISAMALDTSDSSNATVTITTTDTIYNTDELSFYMTDTSAGDDCGITFTSGATFDNLDADAAAALAIEPDYIEFLYADFETEGEYNNENFYVAENALGRDYALTHSDGTASETISHYANPYKDGINTSDYCFYNEGTDNSSAACLVLCSDAFETIPFNDLTLTFSLKLCLLEYPYDTISTSSGMSLAFNQSGSSSTQSSGNSYWTPSWSWVTIAQTAAGVWKELSGTVVQTASGVDVSFTDMCLTMRYNTLKNGFLFDDIVFGTAVARAEAGTGN